MERSKNLIISTDFDGTCVTHEFPRTGADIGAAPVLKALVDEGHKIILNTVRSNIDKGSMPGPHLDNAVKWFEENGIPLYGVNENPNQKHWSSSKKAYAHIYIDDAALGCPLINDPSICDRPFVDWGMVKAELVRKGIL